METLNKFIMLFVTLVISSSSLVLCDNDNGQKDRFTGSEQDQGIIEETKKLTMKFSVRFRSRVSSDKPTRDSKVKNIFIFGGVIVTTYSGASWLLS